MNTIRDEFRGSIFETERWWLRVPAILLLMPFTFFFYFFSGVVLGLACWVEEFVIPGFRGPREIIARTEDYDKQIYPCSKQERKTVIRPSKRKAKGGGWV
jgi:hypothetical protein